LCEPELDHWNVNVDKLLFLYENLRQLIFLTLVEHTLALPVTGLIITTFVLQHSSEHLACNMQYANLMYCDSSTQNWWKCTPIMLIEMGLMATVQSWLDG